MFSFLAIVGTFVALITAYWHPLNAALIFWISAGLIEAYLYSLDRLTGLEVRGSSWSESERMVLEKYHLYFRFPFAAQDYSRVISTIQLSSFVWVPILLFKGYWPFAAILVVNWFVAGPLASKLNIRFFLHDAVERSGNLEYLSEMTTVDRVCEKILQMQRDSRARK